MDDPDQAAEADTGISDDQRAGDAAAVMSILLAHSLTAGKELDMTEAQRANWSTILEPHIDQIKQSPRFEEIATGLVKLFDRLYLDDRAYLEEWGETKQESRSR